MKTLHFFIVWMGAKIWNIVKIENRKEIILPIIEKLSSSFLSVTVLGPNYFGFVQIHATVNTNLMNLVIHLNELFGNSKFIDIVYLY